MNSPAPGEDEVATDIESKALQVVGDSFSEKRVLASSEPMDSSRSVDESTGTIRVASRTGLRLNKIEISIDGGDWVEIGDSFHSELDQALVQVPADRISVSIRAPGHVERSVSIEERIVWLEPDALIEIQMNGMENLLTSIDLPSDGGEASQLDFKKCGLWGLKGPNQFSLAVAVDAYRSEFRESELTFTLRLGVHSLLHVSVVLRKGLRAFVSLGELRLDRETAPLTIQLLANGRELIDHFDLETWRIRNDAAARGREWLFDDGKIELKDVRLVSRIEAKRGRAALEELILGENYRIAAYGARGSAGLAEVQHTGALVRIEMLPGIALRGTLFSRFRPLPIETRAEWRVVRESDEAEELTRISGKRNLWLGGMETIEIQKNGAFEVIVPRRGFPGRPPQRRTPPKNVSLKLFAPGFAPYTCEVSTEGKFEVELGQLELTSLSPAFILESHPFMNPEDLAWSPVNISDSLQQGNFEVAAAERLPDRALAVYLRPAEPQGVQQKFYFRGPDGRAGAEFPAPPPGAIVIHGMVDGSGDHWPIGFLLSQSTGVPRYRSVSAGHQEITVDFRGDLPEAEEVKLGWTWEGVRVGTLSLRTDLSIPRSIELERHAPRGIKTLWWTLEGRQGRTWPPVHEQRFENGRSVITIGG